MCCSPGWHTALRAPWKRRVSETETKSSHLSRVHKQQPLAPHWTDAAALSLLERTGPAGLLGFWRVNLDTDEVQWDPAMFALFGVAAGNRPAHFEELLGHYHPDDRISVARAYVRVLESGEPAHVRYRLRRPGLAERHIFSRAWMSTPDSAGQRWVEGFALDVTGLFEDEALLASERMYRFVAENTHEMIVRLSPEGIIEFASGASRTLLG